VNSDQVKTLLLSLRKSPHDFTVVLSGKSSRKVHGLYKPASREIVIHNRNFTSDGELVYTAIHEYAHHIQFTTAATPVSVRAHTTAFWSLLHELLRTAEDKGLYESPYESIPQLAALTKRIKEKFLAAGGTLMKDLGRLLQEAHELCETHGTNFSDYLDRVLALPRTSAQVIMKAHAMDLDPRIGFENMRTLTAIRDGGERAKAQSELLEGHSPDMVKAKHAAKAAPRDARTALKAERERLERSIETLRTRLKEIEKRLSELGKE
jgi:hypothetical protein